MGFENVIKKISAIVAGFIVFAVVSSFYLRFKGFEMDPQTGAIVLVGAEAHAKSADNIRTDLDDLALPVNYAIGKETAPVTIYEYSSLGCYHCADFHLSVLPKIKKDYIDNGKVKLVMADLPLDKGSHALAMIGRCVSEDKYYGFIELAFKKQREWGLARPDKAEQMFFEYAALNGVDKEKAQKCMKDDKIAAELADIRQGAFKHLKISGTPSFLIVRGNKKVLVEGGQKYLVFKQIIEDLLNENNKVEKAAE